MIAALARRLGIQGRSSAAAAAGLVQLPVTVSAGHSHGRRAPARQAVDDDADADHHAAAAEPAAVRQPDEHAALLATLRQELGSVMSSSQAALVDPPAGSEAWPAALVRRWFEDGGNLTVDALNTQPATATTRPLIDVVGCSLPVVELPPLELGAGGLLGALEDPRALSTLVAALAERDCVTCSLGLPSASLAAIVSEGEQAWDAMRPGELRAPDGGTVSGRSPSNAPRGDRFVLSRNLHGGAEAWPALAEADAALGSVGTALSPQLVSAGMDPLASRSDTFFACFPGDGLGYGSHYDGEELCRLTAILYTMPDWEPEHGGRVQMLNEAQGCWWAVPPRSGTLVIFRSDRVLHKVEACHRTRYALTVFMNAKPEVKVQIGTGFMSGGY